jgi:DNA-binding CsgD family transcriptional regulator
VSVALIHLATGDPKIAAAVVRRRLRQVDPASIGAARLLDVLVRAELEAGATAAAEDAAIALAAAAAATGSEVVRARARRAAGQLALVGGDHAAAADLLEHAAEAFQRAGLPLESARARLLLAEAVRATPARAIAEARDALTAFDRLGAVSDADAAAAILRALGVRASRGGSSAAGSLTRREREVLVLLGAGLSNRQIADRLFITRKTAEHHVANVLAKAGLSGRAEAAAWAIRHLDGEGTAQQGRK